MPDFDKLRRHADALSMLLKEPQEGIGSWCVMVGEHWRQITRLWNPAAPAATELLDACRFVKSFLTKLEDGTEPGDPLIEIRRKFHAPLHAVLDEAIRKAEGKP